MILLIRMNIQMNKTTFAGNIRYQIKSNLSLVADYCWRWSLSVVLFRFLMQIIVLVLFRAQLGAVDDHHLVKWHIEMFLRQPLETCRIYHNLETANANAGTRYKLTSKKEEKEQISSQYSFTLKNMSKGLNRETFCFDDWWKIRSIKILWSGNVLLLWRGFSQ